ncbi:DUF503 domain-containing protein [Geomesophilobacter sediminis]|uniref:DUF503 domain-containing protein n=1 Tax=Geomesophilobacter sediminis TaxID=2798584 RepID=A0A8J7M1Q6_9BACT|nr:DUF503 domain-containing protein [Geomesophilobacter sediminis]MBJ6726879.1 DUF503 domain-containing protein [Geomesophilobacter sediminis]
MSIVLLQLRLRLESRNLKEKRAIVKSILSRARNRFNVACSETDFHDISDDAVLSFVTVADSATGGKRVMQDLESWLVEERPDVEVVELQVDEL